MKFFTSFSVLSFLVYVGAQTTTPECQQCQTTLGTTYANCLTTNSDATALASCVCTGTSNLASVLTVCGTCVKSLGSSAASAGFTQDQLDQLQEACKMATGGAAGGNTTTTGTTGTNTTTTTTGTGTNTTGTTGTGTTGTGSNSTTGSGSTSPSTGSGNSSTSTTSTTKSSGAIHKASYYLFGATLTVVPAFFIF